MPEIRPDLTDTSRCISVHWSLPAQCVLPCTHRENWHETWHPQTGNRIRYRRSYGTFATEELRDGQWHDLAIPAPGDICGEPNPSKPGVRCQSDLSHNETSWTHRAVVDGCTYTWNTVRRDLTPEQVLQDMAGFRGMAAEQAAEIDRLRAELAQEQQVSQERGRYLAEVDAALIAAGEDEGGGYIAYARRIAQLAADRDQARAELAKYVGHEPTTREETQELSRRLDAVDQIHRPADHAGLQICAGCSRKGYIAIPWPCATANATNGDTATPSA